MAAGSALREIFVKMGFDIETSKLATAFAAVEGLKWSLGAVKDAVTKMVTGFADGVKATADYGDRIDELSQQLGLSTVEAQQLGYAAQFSGVQLEDMAMSMGQLAKDGATDLRGELLRLANQMKDASPTERLRIAQERLGRSGKKLIPILSGGGEALKKLFEEAPLMSEEAIKAGARFNDELDRLNATTVALRNQAFLPLLGPLTRFMENLRKGVVALRGWKKENWPKVVFAMKMALVGLSTYLLASFLPLLGQVATATALWIGMNNVTALSLLRVGWAAVSTAAKAALAFAPWLVVAGLVIFAIMEIYALLTGTETLTEKLAKKWNSLVDDFTRPRADDSWLMAELRKALGYIMDIQGAYEKLQKAFTIQGGMTGVVSRGTGAGLASQTVDFARNGKKDGAGWMNFMFGSAGPMMSNLFGVAASPAASAPAAAAASPVVNAPQFNVKFDVHAAPGMDENKIADQIVPQLDAWHEKKMREANAAVQ